MGDAEAEQHFLELAFDRRQLVDDSLRHEDRRTRKRRQWRTTRMRYDVVEFTKVVRGLVDDSQECVHRSKGNVSRCRFVHEDFREPSSRGNTRRS